MSRQEEFNIDPLTSKMTLYICEWISLPSFKHPWLAAGIEINLHNRAKKNIHRHVFGNWLLVRGGNFFLFFCCCMTSLHENQVIVCRWHDKFLKLCARAAAAAAAGRERKTHLAEAEELCLEQKSYWYLICIFHHLKKGEETRRCDFKLLILSVRV